MVGMTIRGERAFDRWMKDRARCGSLALRFSEGLNE
jgi:hypothetical protein